MKTIYIINLVFLFVLYACANHTIADKSDNKDTNTVKAIENISIDSFKTLSEEKQAIYINNLGNKERIKYVADFLKDAIIYIPPNDWVKFDNNGTISDHHSISRNVNMGIIGKWEFRNGEIEIISVGDGKTMNDIFGATMFKWKDVNAEAPRNTNPAILGLNFDDGYLLQYIKTDQ